MEAARGVTVDVAVPQGGDLQSTLNDLASRPETAWVVALKDRPDVDWRAVEAAHREWDHESQGLTGPAAAVVALAVAAATGGAGAALVGAAQGTIGAAVANAALTSLATQASISLINNQGNIGAVLKDLGSRDGIRALATAVVTAGLTHGVMVDLGVAEALPQGSDFASVLQREAVTQGVQGGVATLTDVAINGADFDDSLRSSLQAAAVGALGAATAGEIGKLYADGDIDTISHKLAHAALGCAMGAAGGGDCASGALGGAVGEVVAEVWVDDLKADILDQLEDGDLSPREAVQFYHEQAAKGVDVARLAAGFAALAAGRDVNTAAGAAGNAAENNAICGGFCILGVVMAAGYLIYAGDGDPIAGLETLGAGEDPLSVAIAAGVKEGVMLSAREWPEATVATLDVLAAADGAINATVEYIDENTGQTVSRAWNSLDESTRNRLNGGLTVGSIILPAGSVTKLRAAVKAGRVDVPEVRGGGGGAPKNRTVSVPRSVGADIPSNPVHNINEFFSTITGDVLKSASSRTTKTFQGQRVYRADADIVLQDGSKIRKGDQFYLDGLHKDHLEVFDSRGRPRIKVDLAGNKIGDIPSNRRLP